MSWSLRRALPLSVFLIALGSCRLESLAEDAEDRLLERLIEEYVTARFEFYPVEATAAGLAGNDDRLGTFARPDIERRVGWLADFQQKLSGLSPRRLSPAAHTDALWLSSLVKAELFELEERARWRTTASFYGEFIRAGIVSLLLSSDLPSRTGSLAGRLDEIPSLVEQAKANLDEQSSRLWIEDGVASLDRCLAVLGDLVKILEKHIPSYRLSNLAERNRLAMRSVQSLREVLSERLDAAPETDAVLGEDALARLFLYQDMVDASLDDVFHEASEAVENRTNALIELALERFAGQPLRDLLSSPPATELSEDGVRLLAEEVGRLLALPSPVGVRLVPSDFLAPLPVRLWRKTSPEPLGDVVLLVGVPFGSMAEADVELLTWIELTTRLPQLDSQARSTSLLRRVFAARTTSEGWRSWRWRRSMSADYRGGDPTLRLRSDRRALVEELRLLAVLSFHARGATIEQIQELFLQNGHLSPVDARREAERVALDPRVGSSALGHLLLRRLSRDYLRAFPLSSETELDQRILGEGLVPIRLIRARLLDSSEFES
ncbi:MAG TPA: DUF885 family protein [Vicinamibacteria bacterium]|nr:DUF885 family protein [Vicinamibacteria bacterium]